MNAEIKGYMEWYYLAVGVAYCGLVIPFFLLATWSRSAISEGQPGWFLSFPLGMLGLAAGIYGLLQAREYLAKANNVTQDLYGLNLKVHSIYLWGQAANLRTRLLIVLLVCLNLPFQFPENFSPNTPRVIIATLIFVWLIVEQVRNGFKYQQYKEVMAMEFNRDDFEARRKSLVLAAIAAALIIVQFGTYVATASQNAIYDPALSNVLTLIALIPLAAQIFFLSRFNKTKLREA